jgi:hypothetical protein
MEKLDAPLFKGYRPLASWADMIVLMDMTIFLHDICPSRLPSFSDGPESIGKDREFGEHRERDRKRVQQPQAVAPFGRADAN